VPQWKPQAAKAHDHWNKRVPGVAVGWPAVDGRVAADLHTSLGLGQFTALVRYRGDPCMRRVVVGKLLVDFQPGGQLAGGGDRLVHGR